MSKKNYYETMKPCNSYTVNMARSMDRGHVRPATKKASRNIWAILQLIPVYYSDIGHPCYSQLTPVKTSYLLTSIMLPYCGLRFRAHVFLS